MDARRLGRRDGRRDASGQAAQQPQRHRRPTRRHALLHRSALWRPEPRSEGDCLPGRLRPDDRRRDSGWSSLTDFEKPNGLAFSPDGRTLYVCDTAKYHVRAFELDGLGRGRARQRPDLRDDGPRRARRPGRHEGRPRRAGCTSPSRWASGSIEPDGRLLGIIATPKRPANLNWWGRDGPRLAITAVDAVHQVRLKVEGLTPPFLPELTRGIGKEFAMASARSPESGWLVGPVRIK